MGKKSNKAKPKVREGFKKSSCHSLNVDRKTEGLKGVGKPRTKATIRRLQMYRNFKPKRNSNGEIVRPAPFQSEVKSGTMARIEPNHGWFANSRVITQSALQKFQDEMGKVVNNPFKVSIFYIKKIKLLF